jgi:hypothetical protein
MTRFLPVWFLLAAFTLIGCKGGAQNGDPNAKTQGGQPDFKLTVDEILKECAGGRMFDPAAHEKWAGKTVEVIGEVADVDSDNVRLSRNNEPKAKLEDSVYCTFLPASADKAFRFSIGQKIKALGRPNPAGGGPQYLVGCEVVELDQAKLTRVTAENIAKILDESNGPEETIEKIKQTGTNGLIISGTVKDVVQEKNFRDRYVIHLSGSEKNPVRLEIKASPGQALPTKGQIVEASSTRWFLYNYISGEYGVYANLLSAK